MKRVTVAILTLSLILGGCVPRDGAMQSKKFKVVTSFYPVYTITKNITQNAANVEVVNMTEQHTGCLHDHYLQPSDMMQLEDADVFVYCDDESIQNLPDDGITINAGNGEHLWMSFEGAVSMAQTIADELGKIDVRNKAVYTENANAFKEAMRAKQAVMSSQMAHLPNKNVMIADYSISNFAVSLGLTITSDLSGNDHAEDGGSAMDYLTIIETAKLVKGRAILTADGVWPSSAQIVVGELEENGISMQIVELSTILTGDDDPNAYFKQIDENFAKILAALQ